MNLLLTDPRAALDHRDSQGWQLLQQNFSGDSPYLSDIWKLFQGYADRHLANRPTGDGLRQRSAVVYLTDKPTHDSLNFVWCKFDNSISYDVRTGQAVYPETLSTSGTGTAHRLGGVWRLYSLQVLGEQSHPQGTPSDCPPNLEIPPGMTAPSQPSQSSS